MSDSFDFEAVIAKAAKASKKKNWIKANKRWSSVVDKMGEKAPAKAYSRLAQSHRKLGDFESALSVLIQGESIHGSKPIFELEKAQVATARKDWAASVQRWQTVLDVFQQKASSKMYLKLARALSKLERYDEAEKIIEKGLQYRSKPALKVELAEIAMAQRQWKKAESRWEKVLDSFEGAVPTLYYTRYSESLQNQHRLEDALIILEKAESCPERDDELLLYFRAELYKTIAFWNTFRCFRDRRSGYELEKDWNLTKKYMDELYDKYPASKERKRAHRYRMRARLNLIDIYSGSRQLRRSQAAIGEYLSNLEEYISGTLEDIQRILFAYLESCHVDTSGINSLDHQKQELAEYLQSLKPEALSCDSWLSLYTLLWRQGMIIAACICRSRAVSCACELAADKRAKNKQIGQGFMAFMDNGDLVNAGKCIKRLPEKYLSDSWFQNALAYHNLISGNKKKAAAFFQEIFSGQDKDFFQCIKGKSVAIIGGASSESPNEDEVSEFDAVIKLNAYFTARPDVQSSQIRIISLSSSLEKFISSENVDAFSDVQWIILPRDSIHKAMLDEKGLRTRIKVPKIKLLSGLLNHGMITLYDILAFEPERVKLFNINFYLTSRIYSSGYLFGHDNKSGLDLNALLCHVHHDNISQINFARNLFFSGLVEADPECRAVLEMKQDEYAAKMEEVADGLRKISPNPWGAN